MKQAVVIPSYKAGKTLPGVLERLPKEFWEHGFAVIINDCCPEDTGKVADSLAKDYPKLIVVHHEQNRGYGGAVKTGLNRALKEGADVCAIVHADGQYAPEMVLELTRPITDGEAFIVQGSRFVGGGAREGGMPLIRYIPNRVLTLIENLAFGTDMAEFHSGYMIYSRQLLDQVPFEKLQNNYNFDAEMMVMAHILGYRCREIGIPTRYDDEVSSLDPIPYGLNVLRMIWRYLAGDYKALLKEHKSGRAAGS